MKIEYELTAEDFVALGTAHYLSSPSLRRQRYGCFVISVCIMSALPILILATTDKPRLAVARDIWPLLAGPVLFAMLFIPYLRWRVRGATRRMMSEGKNVGQFGHRTLEIAQDGLRESTSTGVTIRTWSSVEKILVTASHLFIYTSAVEAFVVPRAAFASAEVFRKYVEEVSRHSGVAADRTSGAV